MEKKRYRKAAEMLDTALDEHAVTPYYGFFNKAVCFESLGEPDESLVWYRKALDQKPGDPDALTGAGKCLYRMGAYEQSESYFLQAIEANASTGVACNDLGVLCFVQGRFEEARDWFLKALENDPGNADALYNIADTYEELGDTGEAAKYRSLMSRSV